MTADVCDQLGPLGIARLLRQTDGQLFAGWREHAGIFDLDIQTRLQALSEIAEEKLLGIILKGEPHRFVFTGCGTSGRIAWLCARAFNRILRAHHPDVGVCFQYCISGGDESLVISNELPEDDPHAGTADVKRATKDAADVMVNILTAPTIDMVNGGRSNFTTCLIGFNPVDRARDAPVENWDRTCHQVFNELERRSLEDDDGLSWVLNPIVGPEPITGSSRMKGGSMTHILLNAIFLPALHNIMADVIPAPKHDLRLHSPTDAVMYFERVARQVHLACDDVASLVSLAGQALRHRRNNHLYYVGIGTAGLMGLIDASEMVDTYGCRDDEVRAFIQAGWAACGNVEGDISGKGPAFCLNTDEFERDILPTLTERDTVIVLSLDEPAVQADDTQLLVRKLVSSPAKLGCVHIGRSNLPPSHLGANVDEFEATCIAQCDELDIGNEPIFAMFGLKLILNVITTGANILRGAVHGNTMINVTVSNNKLFYRAAEIVANLAHCSEESGQVALLKAIYQTDEVDEAITSLPLSEHIKKATPMKFIVPTASLMASGKLSLASANKHLQSNHTPLRQILALAMAKAE
ncbi:uncharacterized protein MONBRDRAFT_28326 [Monosiga brevicollis MX1]|uniref:SIS domain-containing protein n=1 Tax=Monosiga brevicollis TaxID=81824 RepID=A9V7U7_MONBE|nr:uncharacterized protein MONBRDRAFT_28326 [Monosiga brevicollis MX1]EDQ86366.1 predicted protein [Monosiga brevicollis MX1]|eukprot:XP_001748756.1 hypothetical protein [Monosiga brevicollis MX1]